MNMKITNISFDNEIPILTIETDKLNNILNNNVILKLNATKYEIKHVIYFDISKIQYKSNKYIITCRQIGNPEMYLKPDMLSNMLIEIEIIKDKILIDEIIKETLNYIPNLIDISKININ